jgi:hypothetical protein
MIELRLLDHAGNEVAPLPDMTGFTLSPVFCDQGAIEFSYPKDGINWNKLDGKDEIEVAVYIDGARQGQLDSVLQDIDGDDIKEAAVWKFSGFQNVGRLNEARVYPPNWPAFDPTITKYSFSGATAGLIMKSLLDAAHARGTLTDITYGSWTTNADSNGVVWDKQITIEYAPGVGYLEILKGLYDSGMVEFVMVGKDLRLYVAGTFGTDRTVDPLNPLVFRKGRDLSDSSRKVSSRGVNTVMLGAGEEGTYHEEVNAPAVAGRRRIEGYISNGNVKDPGTLEAFTETSLEQVVNAKLEKSHGLEFVDASTPRPLRDFNVGDWAFSDLGRGQLERYRIKQWVLKLDDKGTLSGSVQLNDLFDEQNALLTRRVAGIVGGSTITGASQAVERVPNDLVDGVGPAAPAGFGMTSAPFTDDNGVTWAQVTASWAQVTTNVDGTVIEDLAGYTVHWRYINQGFTAPWHNVDARGTATTITWSPVGANAQIEGQVQAYDKMGNTSPWSTVFALTTQDDATAPEKPSTPVADNYAGLLHMHFDGKTASGAAWPPDVQTFQVHASTTSNFTPVKSDPATWVDTLTAAGDTYIDPGYGQGRYFRIIAIDRSGNASVPSDQSALVQTSRLLSDDIFDGAVGTAKLSDLAVTTAKIANLAVNDAQIGSLSATKITAGLIQAALTVSGRIATALTGKRVEMNSIGFQGFDASGNTTISLDGVSNLLMGTFKTALTGRRIEIAAAGTRGEVNFYGPQGQLGKVFGFTDDISYWSSEAVALWYPITGTSSAWNTFTVASDEEAYITSGFVGLYVGGNGTGNKGFTINWAINRGTPSGLLGPGYVRMQVDATYDSFYDAYQNQVFVAGNNLVRMSTYTTAAFGAATGGWLQVTPTTDTTTSCNTWLSANGQYGGYFNTVGNPAEFNFIVGSGTVWAPVKAASFTQASDESLKTAVKKMSGSAREKLSGMHAVTYKLKGHGKGARMQIGHLAHTAPDEIRTPSLLHPDDGPQGEGIDLYGLTTLGIEYVREVDSDLEALRREIAELRELVSK